ncbi:hypothetical protein KRR26_05800 [Corallococcus sp. M34]|uniref:hypothetical protein n=1 Tax=Citreicoccus inhibens TaxID=2849499 RepID=UPI001C225ABB|nr:hypothetical protein [Citreicoccus inhibens]MBU8895107.1 hypothetical protein [Citreicoccus inhibens]
MFIDKGAQSWMGRVYVSGGLFEVINLHCSAVLLPVFTRHRNAPFFARFAAGGCKNVRGHGLGPCGVITRTRVTAFVRGPRCARGRERLLAAQGYELVSDEPMLGVGFGRPT